MLFNSVTFLIFFAVVVPAYFALPYRFRWIWLLAASCFFYGWVVPKYLPLLGSIIVIDYAAGLAIDKHTGWKRKAYLIVSLTVNIGTLFFFKYWDFFALSYQSILQHYDKYVDVILISYIIPIGLSFHTFQAMSYTIEVYRGNYPPEKHLGIYALYVMFFPQLVAGPIERPQNLIHQFREHHDADYNRIRSGLQLMLWGLIKKMVIADTLGIVVDSIFDNQYPTGFEVIIATVCFAYQIYCDFSGYTDIAIGSAQVLGIKLMTNFRSPYHSASIGEFWHRWHISLSTWFRDYLYIPLGGSRVSQMRTYLNLLIVFTISGLWHGANWTYLVWGLINGVALIIEMLYRRYVVHPKPGNSVKAVDKVGDVFLTFTIICAGWIFFRASSFSAAIQFFSRLDQNWGSIFSYSLLKHDLSYVGITLSQVAWCGALIVFLESVEWMHSHGSIRLALAAKPMWMRWSVYYAAVLFVILCGQYGGQKFIYYQF